MNSGRLSRAYCPAQAAGRPLGPGAPCPDAPLQRGKQRSWLLHQLQGGFFGIYFSDGALSEETCGSLERLADNHPDLQNLVITAQGGDSPGLWQDSEGLFQSRYGVAPGSYTLVRPDQHVVASWPTLDHDAVSRSRAAALAQE